MLNYMGPSMPAGPVTSQLPPSQPGSMQAAVPGISSAVAPLPPQNIHKVPAPHGSATPAHALAAIMKHAGGSNMGLPPIPIHPDYQAATQADGSILLHVKLPNGGLGPVVKVIPPIKRPA